MASSPCCPNGLALISGSVGPLVILCLHVCSWPWLLPGLFVDWFRIHSWEFTTSYSPLEKGISWGTMVVRAACVRKQISDFIRLICVGVWVPLIAPVKEAWKLPIIWCTHLRTVTISEKTCFPRMVSATAAATITKSQPNYCSATHKSLHLKHCDYIFL